MPKTVQIRNIDDSTYAALRRRAASVNMTVPEFLRREVTRLANRPTPEEWLERISRIPVRKESVSDTNAALDELRGPWPDAGR